VTHYTGVLGMIIVFLRVEIVILVFFRGREKELRKVSENLEKWYFLGSFLLKKKLTDLCPPCSFSAKTAKQLFCSQKFLRAEFDVPLELLQNTVHIHINVNLVR